MKKILLAAALSGAAATSALAVQAPEKYVLDASHSQVLFSYNHLGYSTTWGMFSGFEGEILFDQENPSASSVTVSMPVARASISLIADSMVLKPSCTRRYKMLPLSVSRAPPRTRSNSCTPRCSSRRDNMRLTAG